MALVDLDPLDWAVVKAGVILFSSCAITVYLAWVGARHHR